MGRTGEVDFNRVLACVIVVAAHLAFFWVMTRKITLSVPAGDAGDALQLTWIEPPASPRSTPPTPATTPVRRVPVPASMRVPPARAPAPVPTEPSVAPPSGTSLRAVFLEQARQLPGTEGDETLFVPDPLAHKRANLPGPGDARFRMRNPPSIRGTLLKIGAMAGGPGYTTDPCPRVASNIGELSQLGDSALLQEELRRKRALCD